MAALDLVPEWYPSLAHECSRQRAELAMPQGGNGFGQVAVRVEAA